MKKLLRVTLPTLLALVGADSFPMELRAQETPETGQLSLNGWEVLVRPRLGYFVPQWDYAEERRLPRRPLVGVEVLLRRKDPGFGARLLAERTGAWQASELADWGSNRLDRLVLSPQRVGTVVADAVLYAFRDQDAGPYFFLGGGSRLITVNDDPGVSPFEGETPNFGPAATTSGSLTLIVAGFSS